MAWVSIKPIVGGYFTRLRYLEPMPRLHFPGAKVNTAYWEAYCPVGGIAFEVWKHGDLERAASK